MSTIQVTQYLLKVQSQYFDSENDFLSFVNDAPKKYKVYAIPKRTSGTRKIAQPVRELKDCQRSIILLFDDIFPIHDCSMAYVKGKDIKKNAFVHLNNSFFLKIDFMDFFNSITPVLFWDACERHNIKFNWLDKEVLENILFWKPSKYSKRIVLSVGAPSSPFISNFIMYDFDVLMNAYCLKKDISYTRYADDLTFSTNKKAILFDVPYFIRLTLKEIYGDRIKINQLKTVFSSKKHNRHVTGLTITNDNSVSIGRAKKRYVKHLVHNFIENKINDKDLNYLRGYLGFIKYVEPEFLKKLEQKYTQVVIEKIRLGN